MRPATQDEIDRFGFLYEKGSDFPMRPGDPFDAPSDFTLHLKEAGKSSSTSTQPATGSSGVQTNHGTSGTSYSYKKCDRHRGELVFTVGKVNIGGASDTGKGVLDAQLIVNCAAFSNGFEPGKVGVWPSDFEPLNKYIATPPVMNLDWSDRQPPKVDGRFFKDLIDIMAQKYPDGCKIVFACQGGHGRTGTALAAVAIQHLGLSAQEAIDLVRDKHCSHAVESKEQETWLANLAAGVTAPPTKRPARKRVKNRAN